MICCTNKKKIPFQIDDSDLEAVSYFSWYVHSGYVATAQYRDNPNRVPLFLHQFLLGRAPTGFEWDHENRDKLDNRRFNLRVVTHAKNMRNAIIRIGSHAIIPGVRRYPYGMNKWQAQIKFLKKCIWLGAYDTLEEAIQARKRAEEVLWKDS